jgi:YesN/AraC family two-component response regulator
MSNIIKEITPLTQNDCFAIFSRTKKSFNLPLHFHEEFELTLIINAPGAKRIIGDHEAAIGEMELVLVGPNLSHTWLNHECKSQAIYELTVQWHKDLFEEKFLKKKLLGSLKTMLEQSSRGMLFTAEVAEKVAKRLFVLNESATGTTVKPGIAVRRAEKITDRTLDHSTDLSGINGNKISSDSSRDESSDAGSKNMTTANLVINSAVPQQVVTKETSGFEAVVELMNILHLLSTSEGTQILSKKEENNNQILYHGSRRIDKVLEYMNNHFQENVTLKDLAKIVSMTEVSFSRFIKKRTGNTFVDTINEIRIGHASRMLIEDSGSIADVAVNCGFNNISNFNRVFKSKKHCTPKEFRENFSGTRLFI